MTDTKDIRDYMKPPKSVGEFMDRAMADPKERRAVEKLTDTMRAEQDELKLCSRCHRKTGFDFNDEAELISQCCGYPGVAADRDPT